MHKVLGVALVPFLAAVAACSSGGGAPRVLVRAAVAAPTSTSSTSTSTSTTTSTVPPPPPPRTSTTVRRATTTSTARVLPTVATAQPGRSLGTFLATCYGAFEGYGGGTASGKPSGPGSIAVDPHVIPMGTPLRVEGYGNGDARDVGGAIKGHRIDVWFRTEAECSAWGSRSVEVWTR